ncbi:MAG: hypothetical protein ACKV2O_09330 [Acidimicrobiales bacterium]
MGVTTVSGGTRDVADGVVVGPAPGVGATLVTVGVATAAVVDVAPEAVVEGEVSVGALEAPADVPVVGLVDAGPDGTPPADPDPPAPEEPPGRAVVSAGDPAASTPADPAAPLTDRRRTSSAVMVVPGNRFRTEPPEAPPSGLSGR